MAELSTLGGVIKTAYQAETNAFTDAKNTKLAGIETSATADQTGAEIKAAYEAEANAYTDTKDTKLAGVATNANNYTHPNHSGDVTSAADGAQTIANNAVTLAKLEDGTQGDILYYGAAGAPTRLGVGTSGQFLQTNGAASNPSWGTPAGSGDVSKVGTPVNNQLGVWTGDGTIEGDAALTWNGSALTMTGTMFMVEQAAAAADVAGSGQIWVKTATPNELWFTDDTGVDYQLGFAGTVADPNADGIMTWDDSATGSEAGFSDIGGAVRQDGRNIRVEESLTVPCSDETTALTTGVAKFTFRMPYAFTLTGVRASVVTAPTGSVLTVDINESGATILSTKITIDATEKTSQTAATAPVISDTALADDAEVSFDIDTVGSTVAGAGLKVTLIGYRP